MRLWAQSHLCQKLQRISSFLAAAFVLAVLVVGTSQPAAAFPAFARKYGLRCSACHESWPMLNYFGQKFKDNGYQLMNDRDAPIWQSNGYWPVTFRIHPFLEPGKHQQSCSRSGPDRRTEGLPRPASIYSGLDILTRRHPREEHFVPACSFLRRVGLLSL